jgi:alpha 1,3-glucosidase
MTESGIMDLFVMLGDEPAHVFDSFTYLTGRPKLPQIFALGYHQCRWNYIDETDVAEVAQNFDKFDIPYDVLWLDIEHTDDKRYFTWDQSKFSQPIKMQDSIAATGRKVRIHVFIVIDGDYH